METAINELYEKADELYGYHIGDKIQVNGIDFYVISDSPATQDYVVALKEEPLTVEEVNLYGGVGTENNHVNRYTDRSPNKAANRNGYGSLAYYSSETCGYPTPSSSRVDSGCKTSYDDSDIKYVIDNWEQYVFSNNELKNVDNYKSRLIKNSELSELGYGNINGSTAANENVPKWVYDSKYGYWTMDKYGGVIYQWGVAQSGQVWIYLRASTNFNNNTARPVINVYKSAITRVNNN